jgi:hypothetical protein
MTMFSFPDLSFCGLYIPAEVPMVVAGLVSARLTIRLLEHLDITRRFRHPALVFTALAAGYGALAVLVLA